MEQIQGILARASITAPTSEPQTPEEWEKKKAEFYNRDSGDLNEKDGYDCKICRNKGWIMRAGQDYRGVWTTFSAKCKCMDVRNTIRRMQKSGLKDIIRDYTFDKYIVTDPWQQVVKDAAMSYAKDPHGWFFVGGQSGIGKTHLCTAVCREFLLEGREVKYMLWRDDIVQLKQLVNDHEKYTELMEHYKNVEVLYIDDLFKTGRTAEGAMQKPTPGDINAAFEILNFRSQDEKKLTIISSECTIGDLVDIDEGLGGRIVEKSSEKLSFKPDRNKNYRLRGAVEL